MIYEDYINAKTGGPTGSPPDELAVVVVVVQPPERERESPCVNLTSSFSSYIQVPASED